MINSTVIEEIYAFDNILKQPQNEWYLTQYTLGVHMKVNLKAIRIHARNILCNMTHLSAQSKMEYLPVLRLF